METITITSTVFDAVDASSVSRATSGDLEVEVLVKRRGGRTYTRLSYWHGHGFVETFTMTGAPM